MRTIFIVLTLCAVTCIQLFLTPKAHAIPAFTRANKVECTTCHTIFPELNEYGEAFLKNGYVYFGKGKKTEKTKEPQTPASTPIATHSPTTTMTIKGDGDADKLSKLKAGAMSSSDSTSASTQPVAITTAAGEPQHTPATGEQKSEGLLLAAIPEQLPISFTANLQGTYNSKAVNELDFSTRTLKLNAGGNFREKVGFFGTYVVYTENTVGINNTSETPTNMTVKNDIGELFIMWRHALDSPVNIKIGRFQPKLGLWKLNNKLSITNRYANFSYTVGKSEFSLDQPQDAIELNSLLGSRLFVAAGAVNRKFQNSKEGYAHISYKIGGADYLANEPDVDLNKEENIFDYLSASVGLYGYLGKNGTPNTVAGTLVQNQFYRYGIDGDILYKLLRLRGGATIGRDYNSDLSATKTAVNSRVGFVEIEYSFLQNLLGAARFEYQNDGRGRVRRYIPTLSYAALENFKLVLEYKHEVATSYKDALTSLPHDFTNKIGSLGLTFSF